jgi:hypothetical protein
MLILSFEALRDRRRRSQGLVAKSRWEDEVVGETMLQGKMDLLGDVDHSNLMS